MFEIQRKKYLHNIITAPLSGTVQFTDTYMQLHTCAYRLKSVQI